MEINKYQNGKIYKIISYSHPELVYYGSTTQQLCKRMSGHKTNFKCGKNVSSSEIVKYDDAIILLVIDYPCNNREQLERKGEYIKNNECVNKLVAGRTKVEYFEDNKDILFLRVQEYREINKERIKKNLKEWKTENKEHVKKYREDTKDNMKKYREDNKDKQKVYIKLYMEANKDTLKEYQKLYREENKENIAKQKKELTICECGLSLTKMALPRHIKTIKHLELMKNKII
jgi:hypothetical protein